MKKSILIADDDENILNLLKLCLPEYEVTTARNGREALDHFEKNKYDLVVLDLMMPKMNGWEACREIKKKSKTPVLILTAKETTEDLFENTPDGFLIKPFDPVELSKKINLMLI
ncbi:response regulator [Candidatus Woesearchaeota archaeon]|nr:response regulator [Candidatus Woesearchaeota archaeon]MBW3014650.1 response regulator [Candidatus Woesearchaeota archaeon]